MQKLILFVAISTLSFSINAQNIEYEKYKWSDTPQVFVTTEYENSKPVIELKDKRAIELVLEKDGPFEYVLSHSIKKVNTDNGIEKNNRVYISENAKRKIIKNKLRVINPNGAIIELNDSDIQEAEDQQTKVKYKYYAVRGLEKGSIIEEILLTRNKASLGGKMILVQSENYVKNVEIEIIYPNTLKYEIKSYNGLPKLEKKDTLYKDKKVHLLTLDTCEELEEEKYSNYRANLKCIAYKLIASGSSLNLNGFNTIAEEIHNFVYKSLDSKNEKSLNTYIENIKFPENASIDDSIKAVEHYVKNDIVFIEDHTSQNASISNTISTKKASDQELIVFYANLYKKLGIETEAVITNNRFEFPFDPKFENMSQLENYLLYFPKTNKFLSPSFTNGRYPRIPYGNGSNFGFFAKTVELGGNEIVMKDTKRIELVENYSMDSLDIEADFTESITNPYYKFVSTMEGYEAENYQFIFSLIDDKQKKEVLDGYLKNFSGESETVAEYQNGGKENVGYKPFIISANFQSNKLIEKNAENVLFKIGEAIGKQAELYQEKQRVTPIEMPFPHIYKRRLKVKISEGYEFNNLEELTMNHDVMEKGKSVAGFHSSYTVNGNLLDIIIYEYYYKTNLPITTYNDFKNVINASADFNKVKIILTKK